MNQRKLFITEPAFTSIWHLMPWSIILSVYISETIQNYHIYLLRCPCCRHMTFPWRHCSQGLSSPSGIRSANSAAPWCTGRFRYTGWDSRLCEGHRGVTGRQGGDRTEAKWCLFCHQWKQYEHTRSTHTCLFVTKDQWGWVNGCSS